MIRLSGRVIDDGRRGRRRAGRCSWRRCAPARSNRRPGPAAARSARVAGFEQGQAGHGAGSGSAHSPPRHPRRCHRNKRRNPRQLRSARHDSVDRRRRPPGPWPAAEPRSGCRRRGRPSPAASREVALAMCGVSTTLGSEPSGPGGRAARPRRRRVHGRGDAPAFAQLFPATPRHSQIHRMRCYGQGRGRGRSAPARPRRRGADQRIRDDEDQVVGLRSLDSVYRRSAQSFRPASTSAGSRVRLIDHLHAKKAHPRRAIVLADAAHAEHAERRPWTSLPANMSWLHFCPPAAARRKCSDRTGGSSPSSARSRSRRWSGGEHVGRVGHDDAARPCTPRRRCCCSRPPCCIPRAGPAGVEQSGVDTLALPVAAKIPARPWSRRVSSARLRTSSVGFPSTLEVLPASQPREDRRGRHRGRPGRWRISGRVRVHVLSGGELGVAAAGRRVTFADCGAAGCPRGGARSGRPRRHLQASRAVPPAGGSLNCCTAQTGLKDVPGQL